MATSSAGTFEELVTCNICLYQYDEDVRKPKFLQCGHTICLFCLQAIRQLDTITCPFCRKCTSKDVSDGAEWVLPNNQYALEMLKWTRNTSNSIVPTAPVEPAEEEDDEQLVIAMAMSIREIEEEEEEVLNIAMQQILLDQQKEQEIMETAVTVIPYTEPAQDEGWASVVSEISCKIGTNKSDYNYQEKVEKHESQLNGPRSFGVKFGVHTDRQDAAAVGFDEGQGHVGTTYEKDKPVIAGKALLKSRLENLANKNKKVAMLAVPLPSKNVQPIAKIVHKFETQSLPQTERPIKQLPKSGRNSKDDGWSSVVSEINSKVLNKKSAVGYDYRDVRLHQTSQAKAKPQVMPKPVICESPVISPAPERYSRYPNIDRSSLYAPGTLHSLLWNIFW